MVNKIVLIILFIFTYQATYSQSAFLGTYKWIKKNKLEEYGIHVEYNSPDSFPGVVYSGKILLKIPVEKYKTISLYNYYYSDTTQIHFKTILHNLRISDDLSTVISSGDTLFLGYQLNNKDSLKFGFCIFHLKNEKIIYNYTDGNGEIRKMLFDRSKQILQINTLSYEKKFNLWHDVFFFLPRGRPPRFNLIPNDSIVVFNLNLNTKAITKNKLINRPLITK